MAGADFYHQEHCDVIVAIGGGSPMDCAKGIGIVGTNRKNILDMEGIDNVNIPGPPLICIPTTQAPQPMFRNLPLSPTPMKKRKSPSSARRLFPMWHSSTL